MFLAKEPLSLLIMAFRWLDGPSAFRQTAMSKQVGFVIIHDEIQNGTQLWLRRGVRDMNP